MFTLHVPSVQNGKWHLNTLQAHNNTKTGFAPIVFVLLLSKVQHQLEIQIQIQDIQTKPEQNAQSCDIAKLFVDKPPCFHNKANKTAKHPLAYYFLPRPFLPNKSFSFCQIRNISTNILSASLTFFDLYAEPCEAWQRSHDLCSF